LIKRLKDDAEGQPTLIGTFIQRPLLYDLSEFQRESGITSNPYFE